MDEKESDWVIIVACSCCGQVELKDHLMLTVTPLANQERVKPFIAGKNYYICTRCFLTAVGAKP